MLHDIDLIRAFDAVATHLNFGRAAAHVGRSPAAISEQIKRLEELFDTPLFARTTRSVALTPAGHRLWPEAKRLIQQARVCEEVVRGRGHAPFELRVGTRFELGLSWLLPALSVIEPERPNRAVHLVFGDSPELMKKTKAGEIDATVTSERLTDGALAYALLHEEHYVFVAAPKLLCAKPLRTARDAAEHRLIDAHADLPLFRYFLDASPREEVWRFARIETMGAIGAIRHRALEGAGVAVLPLYWVTEQLAEGSLVRLLPERELKTDFFRLIWRRDHALEPEIQELAEQLQKQPLS